MMPAPKGNSPGEEETAASQADAPQSPADLSIVPDRASASERITIVLIPKAGQDLRRLQDRTRLSKTDIVNRAISLYEFIETHLSAGKELLIRDKGKGEIQLVLFL